MATKDKTLEVRPLKYWINGTATLHFRHGHVAEIAVNQETADRIRRQLAGTSGPDDIDGAGAAWIQVKGKQVVLIEWDPSPDLGWLPVTPEEQALLSQGGHTHGILKTLVDMWQDEQQPEYCGRALGFLHSLALKPTTERSWRAVARLLQGEAGAQLLSKGDAQPPSGDAVSPDSDTDEPTRPLNVDDEAEPEHATETGDGAGPGSAAESPAAEEPPGASDD